VKKPTIRECIDTKYMGEPDDDGPDPDGPPEADAPPADLETADHPASGDREVK
jgi:hypothetical protein